MTGPIRKIKSVATLALAATAMLCAPYVGIAYTQGYPTQTVAVMDHQGGARPMPAYTITVPQGWQVQGGIVWNNPNHCNTYGYNLDWRASSPDQSQGILIAPMLFWSTAPNPIPGGQSMCLQRTFGGARELLEWFVASYIPSARVLDARSRPDLLAEMNMTGGRVDYGGMVETRTVDAAEILIGYMENGREMRATVATAISGWVLEGAGIYYSGGESRPIYAVYAPDGMLNTAQADVIRKTLTENPEWIQFIMAHRAKIDGINARGSAQRSEIISNTGREVGNIITKGYANRSAVNDRLQREQSESIRGVETYHRPDGGRVELDSMYNHSWQVDDGTYVQSDNPLFDPSQLGMWGDILTPVE